MILVGALVLRLNLLRAVCFAVWAAFHPAAPRMPDAPLVADAIAGAVTLDMEPVFGSPEAEAAVAARYAVEESWLMPRQVGDHGEAHGYWQLHSRAGRGDVYSQVAAWLELLHEGARSCPASPAAPLSGGCLRARRLADRRVQAALEVSAQFDQRAVSRDVE